MINFANQFENFADYDNYDPDDIDGDGNKNEPDGIVDLLILCVRALYGGGALYGHPANGYNSLTGPFSTFGSGNSTLVLDGVQIKAGGFGSGTFQHNIYDAHGQLPIILHEIGHYFFGSSFAGVHLLGTHHFGLMDTNGGGSVMCGLERELLGWIVPTIVTSNLTNEVIADAVSTGDIYKMQKPN